MGGEGNGLAWWSACDAEITNAEIYQAFSQTAISSIDANTVKAALGQAKASAEAAPLINYLVWVLTVVTKVA